MANLPLSRLPVAVAEDMLNKYGPNLTPAMRQELIDHVMDCKMQMPGPMQQRMPSQLDNLYAGSKHMVDYSRMVSGVSGGPKEWMTHMAEAMDSIKEVMTFLAAQDAMQLFGTNKKAQQLYSDIIAAGIAHVFHRRDLKMGEMI